LHRLDGRDIQGIVRRVAGHDGGSQWQAQRVEDGSRDLELGSVGVVLTVAELQEPLLGQDRGVGVGRGGVDADEVGGKLVDADGLLVQVTLHGAEGVAGAEPSEPVSEPVVVGVRGQDALAQEGGERAPVLGNPGLDVVEAVVTLGDDKEEPDGEDFARGERAFPVQGRGEVAVQDGGQVQTLEDGPEDGEIGHDFHTQQAGLGSVHPFSLLASGILENHLRTQANPLFPSPSRRNRHSLWVRSDRGQGRP